jgi:hypothetical protein
VLAVAALGMLLPETIMACAGMPPQEPAQKTKPAPTANPAVNGAGADTVGGPSAGDYSAQATGSFISKSEGSFDSATGITSERGGQCQSLTDPTNPSPVAPNAFTLQLNTQQFDTMQCHTGSGGSGGCVGLEQFVFTNSQCKLYYPLLNSDACVHIQYWLDNWGTPCPSVPNEVWHASGVGNCWMNSKNATAVPPQLVTNAVLESLKLTGQAPDLPTNAGPESMQVTAAGQSDQVMLTIGSTSYTALGDNFFPELGKPKSWTSSEFNIFADGCATNATFNSGTTLQVRTVVDSGTTSAPKCNHQGVSDETNNLNLVGACSGVSGASPAIVFTEALPVTPKGSTVVIYNPNAGQADVVGFDASGKQSMHIPNIGFRTSWKFIAVGDFIGDTQHEQVVLYDQKAGQADVVAFDTNGGVSMDTPNSEFRTSWQQMVAGNFIGDKRTQVLLYDPKAGDADVVAFESNGRESLDHTNHSFGNSWDKMVVGDFLGNGRQQLFLYNQTAGQGALAVFDGHGMGSPHILNTRFRTSWDLIAVGNFIGNKRQQLVLYDRKAGDADVFAFDTNGNESLDHTNHSFGTSWDQMVAGNFSGGGPEQILLYDRTAGQAAVIAFNSGGVAGPPVLNNGLRTTWEQIVVADFIGAKRQQVVLYDGNAGEIDVVAFDTKVNESLDGRNSGYRGGSSDMIVAGGFLGK